MEAFRVDAVANFLHPAGWDADPVDEVPVDVPRQGYVPCHEWSIQAPNHAIAAARPIGIDDIPAVLAVYTSGNPSGPGGHHHLQRRKVSRMYDRRTQLTQQSREAGVKHDTMSRPLLEGVVGNVVAHHPITEARHRGERDHRMTP